MMSGITHAKLSGKLLMVGFGCAGQAGQAVLPLLLRHLDVRHDQIAIITASANGELMARELGVVFGRFSAQSVGGRV